MQTFITRILFMLVALAMGVSLFGCHVHGTCRISLTGGDQDTVKAAVAAERP